MKKYLVIMIACSILLSGCGSSERAVQTAIARTALARPTETNTPIPTTTSTLTPSPTPTITPVPTRAPALNSTFEDMLAKAESWTNAKFTYAYEARGLRAYEGVDVFSGLYIYLLESEGNAAGFILSVMDDPSFDSQKSAQIILQFMESYVSTDSITWISDNWPQEIGDSNKELFTTGTGVVVVVITKEKENNIMITAIDINYLE